MPVQGTIQRILCRIKSRILEHSPLEVFVLACSMLGITWTLLFSSAMDVQRDFERDVAQVTLAALAGPSVGFFLGRTSRTFRLLLVLKSLLLVTFFASVRNASGATLALLGPTLLEIAVFEVFFLSVVISTVLLALMLSVFAALASTGVSSPVIFKLGDFLFLFVFAIVSCLLVYYREKLVDSKERIGLLETAVSHLTESNLGYQNYAREASANSQLEERLRITRELHDIIGYTFTNNIMMLEAAISKIRKDPHRVRRLIDLARENAQAGLQKIRQSLYLLRSKEQPPTSVTHKILELVKIFIFATNIRVRLDFVNFPNEIDLDREHFFYYFIQQAMTNSFLHGAATEIEVHLLMTERYLMAIVRDNGRGAASLEKGIGISGMLERAEALRGKVTIVDVAAGFEIRGEIPYDDEGRHVC